MKKGFLWQKLALLSSIAFTSFVSVIWTVPPFTHTMRVFSTTIHSMDSTSAPLQKKKQMDHKTMVSRTQLRTMSGGTWSRNSSSMRHNEKRCSGGKTCLSPGGWASKDSCDPVVHRLREVLERSSKVKEERAWTPNTTNAETGDRKRSHKFNRHRTSFAYSLWYPRYPFP